ncbi:tetratricopeptide repeat protein [Candidatus Falkowbacteria bacterium]|jgi:tetratricopeptide (TPR) repeat protein|nr:tetratricopeptide repeat protein [Candidatus Falkowbacteria bacterium]
MLTTFSIILLVLSLLVIVIIILKKFPALAILDINNLPGEKETKFKDQIIRQKVERDVARISGVLARIWLFITKHVSNFLQSLQNKLEKAKLNYKASVKIPYSEKKKMIKELFIAYADLLKEEKYAEAEEKLLNIITLDQKNLPAFFKLGNLYSEQKKWPEARETYNYALKLAKQYEQDDDLMGEITPQEIYFSLAWVEKEAGELEAALENIREALELESNNPRYLDLILDLSIMRKDKELAITFLEKLALVNPENQKLAEWAELIEKL